MITRRGGDFWWLQCDSCGKEHLQLLRWTPGQIFADRLQARHVAAEQGPVHGWARTETGEHLGPACIRSAGAVKGKRAARCA